MELTLPPVEAVQGFLLCVSRVAACIMALPAFGNAQTPARIRAGLVLILSLVLFPVVVEFIPPFPFEPIPLAVLVVQEIFLGLLLGFSVRILFTAVELGGTIVGYQMGFAAANVFDPQSHGQTSVLARFYASLALVLFLLMDLHHLFLQALVESYSRFPPGTLGGLLGGVEVIIDFSGTLFELGVQLAAPILALLLLSSFALGIMGRIFPQLNVFLLSYPLNIGLALIVIGISLPFFIRIMGGHLAGVEGYLKALWSAVNR